MNIKNAKPASDLELYEVIIAAYPDEFDENADGDIWDDVMEFVEEKFGDVDEVSELIGRLVYLTHPMESAINGEHHHCIGEVEFKSNKSYMMSAISRKACV